MTVLSIPIRIERTAMVIALLSAVAVSFVWGIRGALSSAWGSIVVVGGFHLWIVASRTFMRGGEKAKSFAVFLAFTKIGLLGFLLWISVTWLPLEPLAFLLGLSSIVTSIFFEGLRGSFVSKE